VKLIVDAQLPPVLAEALREQGVEAVAVRDIGLREAKDGVTWQYAVEHSATIVTKDEDFAQRCLVNQQAPVVVWLRNGNATNPELLAWFLPQWPLVQGRLKAGDKLIEVR
jgi:predicted nuclease of predicted toxin-antitoxin system